MGNVEEGTMTYLESITNGELPRWMFESVGSIGVDASALIYIVWEHVNEKGSFSIELRDSVMDKLVRLGY